MKIHPNGFKLRIWESDLLSNNLVGHKCLNTTKNQSKIPQKAKVKYHKKPKLFGKFTYFAYLCRRMR